MVLQEGSDGATKPAQQKATDKGDSKASALHLPASTGSAPTASGPTAATIAAVKAAATARVHKEKN